MTIPTSIPETLMAHSDDDCVQESKEDSTSSRSMEAFQHILNKVMDKQNEDEIQSFSKWMTYRGYENSTDLCVNFYSILDHIHDYSDCRVDCSKCALKFGTMNKLRLFMSRISTRMKDSTFELYAQHLLSLS